MNTPAIARTLRVLIVSEMSLPYATGGGEMRYALLAERLVQLGHQVTWLSMRQKGSPKQEVRNGVLHRHAGPRIAHPPLRPLLAKLRFMATVALHVLRNRYDVVDCQTYAPLPGAWLACTMSRTPIVATIHDTAVVGTPGDRGDQWLSGLDGRLAGLVERRLYRLSYNHVLTDSQSVRNDLVHRFGLPTTRVTSVPCCVDIAFIDAVTANVQPADMIFVGRLVPHKHPQEFLQVAAMLNEQRQLQGQPPLRLKLIGGGPLADELQVLVRQLNLGTSIVAMGELEHHADVLAHIKSARVLVLPSTREGFGLVLAEAMAAGTAVVAYDIPAVAETLGPELAAALVPAHDLPALVKRLQQLLDDSVQHARHVGSARSRVEAHFDLRHFASRVAAVYAKAIAAQHTHV